MGEKKRNWWELGSWLAEVVIQSWVFTYTERSKFWLRDFSLLPVQTNTGNYSTKNKAEQNKDKNTHVEKDKSSFPLISARNSMKENWEWAEEMVQQCAGELAVHTPDNGTPNSFRSEPWELPGVTPSQTKQCVLESRFSRTPFISSPVLPTANTLWAGEQNQKSPERWVQAVELSPYSVAMTLGELISKNSQDSPEYITATNVSLN